MRNCSGGLQMCGASCVDFLSDNLNCGACGMACPATDSCVAGVCRRLGMVDGGCNPPSLQCGPVCTNIQSDNNNCGRCGAACAGDRLCLNGACVAPCVVGQLRCGAMGACVDTLRDNNNCGACGNVCAPGRPCTAGRCGTYDAIPLPAGVAFIDACALAGHMEVLAGADDSFVLSPIPFAFRYFNTMLAPNAMINVVSNGWIGMDGVGTATYNFPIPQVAVPNSVVAPYEGDNQNEGAQCIATVGVAPMRQWVVQWNHAHHCCGAMAGVDLTYEVVLSETTNTIDFIYQTMTGARAQAVGIENETGTIAVGGCPMGATNCAPSGPASSIRFRPVP